LEALEQQILMIFIRLLSIVLLTTGSICLAQQLPTKIESLSLKSGKVLKGAEFVTEDPVRGIKLLHDGGVVWVKITDLPADFLSKHNLVLPESVAGENSKRDLIQGKIARFKVENPTFRDRDGNVLQSAYIVAIEATGIKLEREGMVRRIDFEKLPQNVVQFFGFDAASVALEKERVAKLAEVGKERESAKQGAASILDGAKALVNLELIQRIEDGYICRGYTYQVKTREVESNRRTSLSGKEVFDVRNVQYEEPSEEFDTVIVLGLPPSFLDTRKWKGTVWFGGWREYLNPAGSTVTARLAFTSKEQGLDYIVRNGFHVETAPEIRGSGRSGASKSTGAPPATGGRATGTGFAVSEGGHISKAFHVVNGAKSIKVVIQGKECDARVIAKDQNNDLAIIKVDGLTLSPLRLGKSSDQKVGDDVFTTGFPDPEIQGENVKLTRGSINAASGIRDNTSMFQVSVGVHGGNSGGPLVNSRGEVVGVIVSKLGMKYFLATSEMPQNVNYAVKSDFLALLLETVPDYTIPSNSIREPNTPEESAQNATFLVRVSL
jgi:S1-C subfamily serine protease